MQIINQTRKCILVPEVSIADSFWRRLSGWMFQTQPSPDQGLYIKPCQSVHTLGMRFPIRAIYINKVGVVLNVSILHPWQWGPWIAQSRGVLELPLANTIGEQCQPGDRLVQKNGNGW